MERPFGPANPAHGPDASRNTFPPHTPLPYQPGSAEETRFRQRDEEIFVGPGASDAKRTVTGDLALNLIRQTRYNIQSRQYNRANQRSSDRDTYSGERKCPTWDGKDPGRTLRTWLRSQLFWQMTTPSSPEQWGLLLYEALPAGTLDKALADAIPEFDRITPDGYVRILKEILVAHQAYIEVELEKVAMESLNLRQRGHNESYTAYVAAVIQLALHIDQQLCPSTTL